MTAPATSPEAGVHAPLTSPGRLSTWGAALGMALLPVLLALVASGVLLAAMGVDTIAFYRDMLTASVLRASGLQDTITRMSPILLIAAGLIVVFRANLWNLGADGQYLLGAAFVAGVGPTLVVAGLPPLAIWLLLSALAMTVGAAWTIVPSWLRSRYGINEIITTLMMSFIGVSLANILVKGPFKGTAMVPQTEVIPIDARLATLPGTSIHIGVFVALAVCVIVYVVFARTAFGTRIDVLGANPRAAVHLGINVKRLIVVAFLISGALVGLAASMDIQGIFGYMRADWNPAYGLAVVPIVFLARLNALAVIPFAFFFSMLYIGGAYAARRADLPADFVLLFIGLMLLFMVVTQYLRDRRARGEPILPRRPRRATSGA
jgi:general nucleoside transport system permease protein